MLLVLLYVITVKSAYYIGFAGYDIFKYVTKCETRDDLVDEINSMDLSFQRLPTIIIDEDLELDCNELPMFYYKVATLHRANTFPTYSFISNKTDGFATFTLDTSTNSEDNCPGFSFTNITVVFKGSALNTSIMSIGSGVSITSDPGFELQSTISEIPLNFLPSFPNLSFCRLTILPVMTTIENINDTYLEDIELNLKSKYAEAYMISIDLLDSCDVLFDNNTMYAELFNKTTITVHFPDIINYSNAFYFNIKNSNISLSISGDINYTDQFPHYVYINQDFTNSANINITLNPGNYLSKEGTCFNSVSGERFSMTLSEANLFWNNPTPIRGLTLYSSHFYIQSEFQLASSFHSTLFEYYGFYPIHGNFSVNCDMLILPFHIEPDEGCTINITASQTADRVDFNGDLHITSQLTNDINVTRLFLVDEPLINLGISDPIWCNEVHGKARIAPYVTGAVGTTRQILCANLVDTLKVENFVIESEYGDAFQPVIFDGCLWVNKTKSTTQSPTIYIRNEDFDWTTSYETFQKKLTFSISVVNYELDLTVLSRSLQPVSIVLQNSKNCSIFIKIDQESADKIESIQFGSSATPMNITWSQNVSLHCDVIVYKSCQILPLFEGLNLTNMGTITLKDFTQLNEIEKIASNFNYIVLSVTAKVKNFTFTETGWRVYTSTMPEDEELEIPGFKHPNILLPITSTNVFGPMFGRMMNIGLETNSPFPIYISFSTSLSVYLLGGEKWEEVDDFQPIIIVSLAVTLVMQTSVIPINFDDDKFGDYLNRLSTRSVLINRTSDHILSIISSNSPFNLKFTIEISVVGDDTSLYIEINKEATIHGAATITHADTVFIVFRDKLIMDNAQSVRMWRESNSIYMYNSSILNSPSFMDEIVIVWNCTDLERNKPSSIESAIYINLFKFEFANQSHTNVSENFERFFNQPFQIANSVIDITCDELMSRMAFVDDRMSFNFSNKVISFEVICIDLIYSTHPVTFNLNGYQTSGFPSHIALFLNRSMKENDGFTDRSAGKTDLDPGVIACIIIGVSTATVIIVCLSIYFIKRRKHSIENLVN